MSFASNPPSSTAWALRLPVSSATALAALRLTAGIDVAQERDDLWLRGRSADETLVERLRAVPAVERFAWLAEDRLRPVGALLITGKLPPLTWQPLQAFVGFSLPTAKLPAVAPAPLELNLQSSHAAQPANAAIVATALLLEWMLTAPELRLRPLRFAASADGRALVLGSPLPSLSCRHYYEAGGVVLPAGFALAPAVSATVVRSVVGATDGALVLWDEEGPRILHEELFVTASRGAARATRTAMETA